MERPTKGGRPGLNPYPRATNSRNPPAVRFPPISNKFMHNQQPYQPYDMYSSNLRCIVPGGAVPNRYTYPYLSYLHAAPIYSNSLQGAPNGVHISNSPIPFSNAGLNLNPPPPSAPELTQLVPNSVHHHHHVSLSGPVQGPQVPKEAVKRRPKAIEILDPSTMKPINIGEEGTPKKAPIVVKKPEIPEKNTSAIIQSPEEIKEEPPISVIEDKATKVKEEVVLETGKEVPEEKAPEKQEKMPLTEEPNKVEESLESKVNEDVTRIEEDIQKVEEDIQKVEEDIQKVEEDAKILEESVKKVEENVSKVEEIVQKVEENVQEVVEEKVINSDEKPSEEKAVKATINEEEAKGPEKLPEVEKESKIEESTATGPVQEAAADQTEEVVKESAAPNNNSSEGISLKYPYKPNQWSPSNPSGLKQYDSSFLKLLQGSPLSLQKPHHLPELEIIKSTPNAAAKSSSSSTTGDFMPSFSSSGSSIISSRLSLSKRSSRDGRGSRPPMVNNNNTSLGREKVELRTTNNPWCPWKEKTPEEDSLELLGKKVTSILNKLTPQKFDDLIASFKELQIDSESKLKYAIELIFQKAIDEPNYSLAYARMCESLQSKSVESAKFRTIIINKCQAEFEKEYMSAEEKEKYASDMAAAKTEAEKKSIKEDFEARELRARRRSLGNIRFIGEIFKRGLLSISIMHGCIHHLLNSGDEESLESLCRLLTTVGKKIEADTSESLKSGKLDHRIRPLDQHFSLIHEIIARSSISNRIRFMLQDILDLRASGWVPRRDSSGPKTLDQIHQEVAREKKAAALNSISNNTPRNRSLMGSSSGGSNKVQPSQKTFKSNHFNNSSGEWSSISSKKSEPFDMELMKNINNKMSNIDNMKFVPNSSKTLWGKGSSTRKVEAPIKSTNRFSSFSDEKSGFEPVINKSSSLNRNARSDRDFSRGGERTKDSRSMRGVASSEPKYRLCGPSELSEDKIKFEASEIFNAYVRNNNMDEALSSICRKFNTSNIKEFLEILIDKELDSKKARREYLGIFIDRLLKEDLLSISDVKSVIESFHRDAPEYLSDIPGFWEYFVEILSILYSPSKEPFRKVLPLSSALEYLQSPSGLTFVSTLLSSLHSTLGPEQTHELFQSARVSKNDVEKLIEVKPGLSFLRGGNEGPHLRKLFEEGASNEDILLWIQESVGKDGSEGIKFVRSFVKETTRSAIKMPQKELDLVEFNKRIPLLVEFLGSDSDKQLHALFSIQKLIHELTYPPGLLASLFSRLSESDVILDTVFWAWKKDESLAERDGKGVCVSNLNRFFEAIQ